MLYSFAIEQLFFFSWLSRLRLSLANPPWLLRSISFHFNHFSEPFQTQMKRCFFAAHTCNIIATARKQWKKWTNLQNWPPISCFLLWFAGSKKYNPSLASSRETVSKVEQHFWPKLSSWQTAAEQSTGKESWSTQALDISLTDSPIIKVAFIAPLLFIMCLGKGPFTKRRNLTAEFSSHWCWCIGAWVSIPTIIRFMGFISK